jgi:bifunctional UDP-N-acetylglucosamine pyrophosphorylase/glucosamine-1-phosphate N-acetyltransferase
MSQTKAIILAAGQSTRMKSDLPKVLHDVCGRPMLSYVIEACRQAGAEELIAVVGHRRELVMETFRDEANITWVTQEPQLGTGHAVMVCREALQGFQGNVLILYGDGPCIKGSTLQELLRRHEASGAAVMLLTTVLDEPSAYGRIVRDDRGALTGIVEFKDCTPQQAAIREVNPGYYCFRAADLLWSLERLTNKNAKGEYYLTDTVAALIGDGRRAEAVPGAAPEEMAAANSRAELVGVTRILHDRILAGHMENGVTIVDPGSTFIDSRATIGQDTVVRPFTVLDGRVAVGARCVIGPFAHLLDGAVVADEARVGSFAQARAAKAARRSARRQKDHRRAVRAPEPRSSKR